jgi:hypothetical protein
MNENIPPQGLKKEDSQSLLVSGIRDGILYATTLMAVITLANHFALGIYIQDAKLVFIDYLIFGIAICIVHMISDKLSVYVTSNIIMNSIKEKKKIPGRVFLTPWLIEVIFDYWLLTLFGYLSVHIMFEDVTVMLLLLVVIRFFNGIFESIIKMITRRGE